MLYRCRVTEKSFVGLGNNKKISCLKAAVLLSGRAQNKKAESSQPQKKAESRQELSSSHF